jgi:hypothetical protein
MSYNYKAFDMYRGSVADIAIRAKNSSSSRSSNPSPCMRPSSPQLFPLTQDEIIEEKEDHTLFLKYLEFHQDADKCHAPLDLT